MPAHFCIVTTKKKRKMKKISHFGNVLMDAWMLMN